MSDFQTVKQYVAQLGLRVVSEDAAQQMIVVDDEARGIHRLIIDCEPPIVVLEQSILALRRRDNAAVLLRLLQMNRALVHGAFAVDEKGERIIFRDTLQLGSLDFGELEATVNALSLGLAENASELLAFAKA